MNIPKPNEFAQQGGFKPFPPKWERWLSAVRDAIISAQPSKGRHVTVDEQPGQGTIVNVDDTSTRRPTNQGLGACCYDDGTCDDLTESDCTDAGGNWQGPDTTCDDDPNPCRGACCEGEDGTTCIDDSTPDSCAADGGIFQDFGSTCEDVDCTVGACCNDGDCSILSNADCLDSGGIFQGGGTTCDPNPCECVEPTCAFSNPLGDGRCFLTATYTQDVHLLHGECCLEDPHTRTWTDCVESPCSGVSEFSFDCSTGFIPQPSGCDGNCVGVYAGCDYLPGTSISGDTVTFEYGCPNGCTPGVDCTEYGTLTTTYSDEVTCCP